VVLSTSTIPAGVAAGIKDCLRVPRFAETVSPEEEAIAIAVTPQLLASSVTTSPSGFKLDPVAGVPMFCLGGLTGVNVLSKATTDVAMVLSFCVNCGLYVPVRRNWVPRYFTCLGNYWLR
jgi:hypothetical protein